MRFLFVLALLSVAFAEYFYSTVNAGSNRFDKTHAIRNEIHDDKVGLTVYQVAYDMASLEICPDAENKINGVFAAHKDAEKSKLSARSETRTDCDENVWILEPVHRDTKLYIAFEVSPYATEETSLAFTITVVKTGTYEHPIRLTQTMNASPFFTLVNTAGGCHAKSTFLVISSEDGEHTLDLYFSPGADPTQIRVLSGDSIDQCLVMQTIPVARDYNNENTLPKATKVPTNSLIELETAAEGKFMTCTVGHSFSGTYFEYDDSLDYDWYHNVKSDNDFPNNGLATLLVLVIVLPIVVFVIVIIIVLVCCGCCACFAIKSSTRTSKGQVTLGSAEQGYGGNFQQQGYQQQGGYQQIPYPAAVIQTTPYVYSN